VAPEIEIPELEGKTAKMYRGGKICLTIHFKPLWAKNRCVFGGAWAVGQLTCLAIHFKPLWAKNRRGARGGAGRWGQAGQRLGGVLGGPRRRPRHPLQAAVGEEHGAGRGRPARGAGIWQRGAARAGSGRLGGTAPPPGRAPERARRPTAHPLPRPPSGPPPPPRSPHFGFAHALCLGLAPWLAAEVPYLVEAGEWARGEGGREGAGGVREGVGRVAGRGACSIWARCHQP
jgi:hypothetical protein